MKHQLPKLLFFFVISFFSQAKSQTVFSEDFEGMLNGWYCNGAMVATENSRLPHSGAVMVSLSNNDHLTTPSITLPTGVKFVSFWFAVYNPTPLYLYSMELWLDWGGNPDLALGTYNNDNDWTFKEVLIASSYAGPNFSLDFHAINYANAPNHRFYIDDVLISSTSVASLSEPEQFSRSFKVFPNPATQSIIQIAFAKAFQTNSLEIEVFDASGKRVLDTKNAESGMSLQIDLTGYEAGLYTLKISNGKSVCTNKISLLK